MPDNTVIVSEAAKVYRPLSGLALLSLGLGVLAPLSLLSLHPVLFMLLPVPGLIVAMMARRRIAYAEGTMAGQSLATAGLAMNLVSGLAWISMYAVTGWFIKRESQAFVERWITKIHNQNEGEVFLDTRPPKLRKINFPVSDINKLRVRFPAPGGSSEFDRFRTETLTSVLMRYGNQLQWHPVGVVDWNYDKESFMVRHRYRVMTDDRRFHADVDLVATSETVGTSHGPRRDWKVAVQGAADVATKTDYMRRLTEAERDAVTAIVGWTQHVGAGQREQAVGVLADPTNRLLKAEHDYLYTVLRKGAGPNGQAELRMDQMPQLVKEVNDDAKPNAWKLTFRAEIPRGADAARNTEWLVECLITVQTDNFEKGPPSWRITDCKFLGEHARPSRVIIGRPGMQGSPAAAPPQ
jgi:hypothetical protein